MYIPEIKNTGDYDYPVLWVGEVKVGSFYACEGWQEQLDLMYAKMIREFLEGQGVTFYEEEQEDEDW